MKLTELNPNWVSHGGEGVYYSDGSAIPFRDRIGINFDCPCGCKTPLFIPFRNPVSGGDGIYKEGQHPTWQRVGETFEDLTLTPSILRTLGCKWHGFITNGEIVNC